MEERRKGWTKPELTVLGKGNPEERVLCGCKYSSSHNNPVSDAGGCDKRDHHNCVPCLWGTQS